MYQDPVGYTYQYLGEAFLPDGLNYTLAPTKHAPFNLTAKVTDNISGPGSEPSGDRLGNFEVTLPSCKPGENDQFLITIISNEWPGIDGWKWKDPLVNLHFDSETANVTLSGYYAADSSNSDSGSDNTRGQITISFLGFIDAYHSDTLVNNSASPTWIRTVGFGNNSLNIGYSNHTSAASCAGSRVTSWSVVITTTVLLTLALCI